MPYKKKLPVRTAERFFLYARFLKAKQNLGAENVFSHELSLAVGISPEQVRQDLMILNIRGTPQKGYAINAFLAELNIFLRMGEPVKAILAGAGNMGRALLSVFSSSRPNLQIAAAFDYNLLENGKKIAGCPVYHFSMMPEILRIEKPAIGIIAVPPEFAQQIADGMSSAGIKGILNFSLSAIKSPPGVFLEQVDILMALEKTAFFAREGL